MGLSWKTLLLGKMESNYLHSENVVAEAHPEGGLPYGADTGSGMTLGEIPAMIRMISARGIGVCVCDMV